MKDFSYSTFQSYPQTNFCVQCHSGTLRNFVKRKEDRKEMFLSSRKFSSADHFVPFLNQCALEKAAQRLIADELTPSFSFARAMRSSTSDLLNSTFERSLRLSSHSNDHSPRNAPFSLTPTNVSEQSSTKNLSGFAVFSCRSFPHLSPTTPVDPSVTNLGLLAENSSSSSSTSFKKSTSMKFAQLVEHPSESKARRFPSFASNDEDLLVNYVTFNGKHFRFRLFCLCCFVFFFFSVDLRIRLTRTKCSFVFVID